METLPSTYQLVSDLNSLTTKIKQNPAVLIRGAEQQPLGPGEQ
jgi:hypothetical protein